MFGRLPTGSAYFVIAATFVILFLAANTAFNGFPVLGSILARDGYLPRQLHTRGDRLAFSNGIIVLALLAIVLIIAYQADVTPLIQLYVVGVFVSFTCQPARHGRGTGAGCYAPKPTRRHAVPDAAVPGDQRDRTDDDRHRAGHRPDLQVHPGRVHRDHRDAAAVRHDARHPAALRARALETALVDRERTGPCPAASTPSSWSASCTSHAAGSGLRQGARPEHPGSPHRDVDPDDTARWCSDGRSRLDIPLKVVASPYREVTIPILDYIANVRTESPRDVVRVYIPEYVVGHWWEQLLHNQSALRLKARLLFTPGVMVTSVPYLLKSSAKAEQRAERDEASRPRPAVHTAQPVTATKDYGVEDVSSSMVWPVSETLQSAASHITTPVAPLQCSQPGCCGA